MLGRSRYSRTVSANVGESIASALSGMAYRFANGASSMGIDTARLGNTARLGDEAAKLGNDALRGLSKEVERRPLVTLAVRWAWGFWWACSATVADDALPLKSKFLVDGSHTHNEALHE